MREQEWSQSTFFKVNCIQCGANNLGLVGFATEAQAIAAWNRRSTPADTARAGEGEHHVNLLGQALHDVLVAAGAVRNVEMTGPELLLAAHDFCDAALSAAPTPGGGGGDQGSSVAKSGGSPAQEPAKSDGPLSAGAVDAILGHAVPGPTTQMVIEALPLHHSTAALVCQFAFAIAEKLAKAEQKYGYSDGWRRDDWEAECRRQLHHHTAKGDPRDVAAYAAFCWHHGWSTASPEVAGPSGRQGSGQ